MKVRCSSKFRAARQPRYRMSYEPDYDHSAWLDAAAVPTPDTHPDAFYMTREEVRPLPAAPCTRKPPHRSLSIGALRRRLYRAGVKSGQVAALAREIHCGPDLSSLSTTGGCMVLRWPVRELEQRYGRRIARAVRRFVQERWLILDEAWSLLGSGAMSDVVQLAMQRVRKYNAIPVQVTQSVPTDALLLSTAVA